MTDLPQLELLLIDAAERRTRRRRVRRGGVRLLVVAAAAVLAVLVVPRLVRDAPDREIPAVSPAPRAPRTFDEAFSVFRRGEVPADKAPDSRPGDETRLIASTPDVRAYLLHRGSRMCIATRETRGGSSVACAPVSLDPKEPQGHYTSNGKGGRMMVLAFPDGVSEVTANGVAHPVRTNGVIIDAPRWPIDLEWMTPTGPTSRRYQEAGAPTADMAFAALRRPEGAADKVAGHPGARQLFTSADVRAWLVPRDGGVCLLVHAVDVGRTGARMACRERVEDVRDPIIMGVPHGRSHVVAMVFPDGARASGMSDDGFLLIRDGSSAVNVRYTDRTGERRVDWFPEGVAGFVLHARAETP